MVKVTCKYSTDNGLVKGEQYNVIDQTRYFILIELQGQQQWFDIDLFI